MKGHNIPTNETVGLLQDHTQTSDDEEYTTKNTRNNSRHNKPLSNQDSVLSYQGHQECHVLELQDPSRLSGYWIGKFPDVEERPSQILPQFIFCGWQNLPQSTKPGRKLVTREVTRTSHKESELTKHNTPELVSDSPSNQEGDPLHGQFKFSHSIVNPRLLTVFGQESVCLHTISIDLTPRFIIKNFHGAWSRCPTYKIYGLFITDLVTVICSVELMDQATANPLVVAIASFSHKFMKPALVIFNAGPQLKALENNPFLGRT